jgi:hypothetical protein
MWNSEAPSIRAASSRSRGSESRNWRRKKMPKALVARGTISPCMVLVQPRLTSRSYRGMRVTWNGSMSMTRMATKTRLRPGNSSRARA